MNYFQTNFNTVLALLIKEIRLSQNIPIGAMAQALKKSSSYPSKLENGKISLNVNTLSIIANEVFKIPLSQLIFLAERYSQFLISATGKWYIVTVEEINDKDDLIKIANEFYKNINQSKENPYKKLWDKGVNILNTPFYNSLEGKFILSPLFEFILNKTLH